MEYYGFCFPIISFYFLLSVTNVGVCSTLKSIAMPCHGWRWAINSLIYLHSNNRGLMVRWTHIVWGLLIILTRFSHFSLISKLSRANTTLFLKYRIMKIVKIHVSTKNESKSFFSLRNLIHLFNSLYNVPIWNIEWNGCFDVGGGWILIKSTFTNFSWFYIPRSFSSTDIVNSVAE